MRFREEPPATENFGRCTNNVAKAKTTNAMTKTKNTKTKAKTITMCESMRL